MHALLLVTVDYAPTYCCYLDNIGCCGPIDYTSPQIALFYTPWHTIGKLYRFVLLSGGKIKMKLITIEASR